jgi:hypothetical protein
MSHHTLSQRFKRNPWPWLIGVLLLILTLMWVRERKLHQYELKESYQFHRRNGFFAGLKIPPFHDPFGNIYSFYRNDEIFSDSAQNKVGDWWFIVTSHSWQGSHRRTLVFDRKSLLHGSITPLTARDLPAILFPCLLVTFIFLWLRNARQRRIPQV